MKKLYIVILSLAAAISAFPQSKTVTNQDLEKYCQQRLEAERQLKERYAEMGFPSPEQLERQNTERRAEMERVSSELRTRRIQEEMLARANEQLAARDAQMNYLLNQSSYITPNVVYSYGYPSYGFAPFGFYRGGRFYLRGFRNLPPNVRTVQEYAAMYPNARTAFNRANGNFRIGVNSGGVRFSGGFRTGGFGGRIR